MMRWVDAVAEPVTFSQATEFTESSPNAETISLEDACLLHLRENKVASS